MPIGSKFAASSSTSVVASVTSLSSAAHDRGERDRPLPSVIRRSRSSSVAARAVERPHLLAGASHGARRCGRRRASSGRTRAAGCRRRASRSSSRRRRSRSRASRRRAGGRAATSATGRQRRSRTPGRCSEGSPPGRRRRSRPTPGAGSAGRRPSTGSSSPSKSVATSRARPTIESRSTRFIVGVTSSTWSCTGSTSASGVPGSIPSGRTMIPAWSVPSPISSSARIIPRDTSPRSGRSSSGPGKPGRSTPGSPTATVAPTPKFQAPQTICRGSPSPTSTWQSWSLSAFGCLSAATHPADAQIREVVALVGDADVDAPAPPRATRPRAAARSRCASASTRTYSRSQESGRSSELPREAKVVAPELPQVGELVAEHRDPLEPPAEGEAACTARGRSRRTRTASDRPCPAPPTSIQPECRQTGQPAPSQTWHETYASIDGSVKGK